MKVTGYDLREALRRWQLRRDTATSQFPKVLTAFKGESKASPADIAERVSIAENAIARLQTAQAAYNIAVRVVVDDEECSLLQLIKHIGGLGRVEKMWRTAATGKEERFGFTLRAESPTRKADEIVAERTISYEEAGKRAADYGKTLGEYRKAIAIGNAREVDIESLDAALFE